MSRVKHSLPPPPPRRICPARSVILPLLFALLLLSFSACGGNSPSDNVTGNGGTPDPDPYITMTTTEATAPIYLAGTGSATIDWGGKTETVTLGARAKYTNADPMTGNKTIKITAPGGVTLLECNNLYLTSLDVSHMPKLTRLDCYSNDLDVLDVTKNTALETLYCDNNELTTLDVSHNVKLTILGCSNDGIESLNVANNTELKELSFYNITNLTVPLDFSHNTKLERLLVYNINNLTSLDLTANTALSYVACDANDMDADAVNALFGTLHGNTIPDKEILCDHPEGYDPSIATTKGWTVK